MLPQNFILIALMSLDTRRYIMRHPMTLRVLKTSANHFMCNFHYKILCTKRFGVDNFAFKLHLWTILHILSRFLTNLSSTRSINLRARPFLFPSLSPPNKWSLLIFLKFVIPPESLLVTLSICPGAPVGNYSKRMISLAR